MLNRFARLATEAYDRCSSPRMACVVLALPRRICPIDPSTVMIIILHHHMLGPNTWALTLENDPLEQPETASYADAIGGDPQCWLFNPRQRAAYRGEQRQNPRDHQQLSRFDPDIERQ